MKIKTKKEALKLIDELSEKFKFNYLIVDSSIFNDDYAISRTKHWNDRQFKMATKMLDDKINNGSLDAIEEIVDKMVDDIINQIESFKK